MSAAGAGARRDGAARPAAGLLTLGAAERLLVVAPHPDDESLATAGLLQQAVAAGARVRVLYATDGDFNPWAQLAVEGRWPITAAARARWGSLRRAEALRALGLLGVAEEQVSWLGLPDQRLTRLLLGGDGRLIAALAGEIRACRATLVAAPSCRDHHPDHSAVSVALGFALARLGSDGLTPRLLSYRVHPRPTDPGPPCFVSLGPAERERKRAAIRCHATQLRWRPRGLLAYAREHEGFEVGTADPREPHPIRAVTLEGARLGVEFAPGRILGLGPRVMRVALEGEECGSVRLAIRLAGRAGSAPVRDTATGRELPAARLERAAASWRLAVPLEPMRAARVGYVKLERPAEQALGLFDAAGWRSVAVRAEAFPASGDEPATWRDLWQNGPAATASAEARGTARPPAESVEGEAARD